MTELSQRLGQLSAEKRALLEAMLREKGIDLSASVIVPREREGDALPLSFAQERLWFLDQLEPGNSSYNIPLAVHVRGVIHVASLTRSLNFLIQRHESLRTTFHSVDGKPVQVVDRHTEIDPTIADLRALPAGQKQCEVERLAYQEGHAPFDLERGPLVRMTILTVGEEEYYVLLTMHHIVSDGWSMRVLMQELMDTYRAYVVGDVPSLHPLQIQYADFASWQRQYITNEVLDRQLSYWRKTLDGCPDLLRLPTDHPRPSEFTYRGAVYDFTLSNEHRTGLKSLGQREGTTLFMSFLAVFQLLLSRYSGQEDICIGMPIANRTRAELEVLIGFFVNTLVLRGDLSGNPTFRTFLRQVRDAALGAYAHQDVPFELLVQELTPARSMSHSPLFQVMFDFQNVGVQQLTIPGLVIEQVPLRRGVSQFDLTLSLVEKQDGIDCSLEYSTDLFETATIERLARHYERLVREVIAQPDIPVSYLEFADLRERHTLLTEWNSPVDQVSIGAGTIHGLFELQAIRTPGHIAVSHEGESLTYSELDQRARRLAQQLKRLGVSTDTMVAVGMNRRVELIVAVLGILKAGAAYLPLDPAYPEERIALIMEDTGVQVVVTERSVAAKFRLNGIKTLVVDEESEGASSLETEDSSRLVHPENLAYVIYTSGSTGRPKGVLVPHRSAVNHHRAFIAETGLCSTDRVLQFASLSFDASVEEIFPALAVGATLVLRTEACVDSLFGFDQFLKQESITVANLPTAYWHEWVREMTVTPLEIPPSLRLVIIGGEAASGQWLEKWQAKAENDIKLINTYGPTETTITSTVYDTEGREPSGGSSVPIGRPIANGRAYVLDSHLQLVPIGIPGELFIGGLGVARGYWNRPDLTAEKFLPDPYCVEKGLRMYRTGDRARYLPDGALDFLGRVDFQVKVRGFRIEPGEIEAVLRQHESIGGVIVVVRDDGRGNNRLVCYVLPKGGTTIQLTELRSYLRRRLPEYMIPGAFVIVTEWPLNANGKIDCNTLPTPEESEIPTGGLDTHPRTMVEEVLMSIWQDVLGIKHAGVDDSFFDLGGHSLLATQLVSRIRNAFHIELPVRAVFEHPTVRSLARGIEQAVSGTEETGIPPIVPVPRRGELPLSFAQQRLWFLDQLEPGSALYNIPTAVRLKGRVNTQALEKSLNEVVRRHEVLRTNFPMVDGHARQVVVPELHLCLEEIDLGRLPVETRQSEASHIAAIEAQHPFDLSRCPLVRALLLRVAENECILLLTLHHIVADGWSMDVLIREIAGAYNAYNAGGVPLWKDLSIQYADYAIWQNKWIQGDFLEKQLEYWTEQLRGSPPMLDLPTDHPRPGVQSFRGARYEFAINESIFRGVRAVSREAGVTPFMALLAAFQVLLSRYCGQEDISVGIPIANRNRVEVEDLIGFFVNTLVLRSNLSGNPTLRETLHRVREVALGAYAHQDVPFEKIVDRLQPERALGHSPLFQVMFTFQPAQSVACTLDGLTLEPLEPDTGTAKFDIVLFLVEEGEQISGYCEFCTDLFTRRTIERMMGHYLVILERMISGLDRRIGSFSLLRDDEAMQILGDWNTDGEACPERCLHHLFEEQASRSPDAYALDFDGMQVTYSELNEKADRLARQLKKMGVKGETIVGVCLDRSMDFVVAILGVMKAGGAYLPLDPAYPRERLTFMMQDAAFQILLTHSALATELPTHGMDVVCLDCGSTVVDDEGVMEPSSDVMPDNLAYVIYTSGSTGRPKGVLINHRSAVNLVIGWTKRFDITSASRVLQFFSYSFDGSVADIFGALSVGATLCMTNRDTLLPGAELNTFMRDHHVTAGLFPPAALSVLPSDDLPDLRTVISGGESCAHEIAAKWGNGRLFFNAYGPTESTVGATAFLMSDQPLASSVLPLGRPFANYKVYILDPQMQPAPIGVAGELCVGNPLVLARGYLNRPETTAERFVPDPWGPEPGGRLYRTGDLCRFRSDGTVEYLGRLDQQVKIRGFRVELGEIESVLALHPAVQESVVVAQVGEAGTKRLVAYIVPRRERTFEESSMRSFLEQKLPAYMIPAFFVILDSLPLTPNGKIDRARLPAPEVHLPTEGEPSLPRTEAEKSLAAIWCEVLRREQVGLRDNFFEIGGDSILAIQVVARANQAGLRITPRILFQHPTIAELASEVHDVVHPYAEQDAVSGPVPLTPIQRWFFEQRLPEPHHWNQSLLFELTRPLNRNDLEETVRHLLQHHDALRMRFEETPEGWRQVNSTIISEASVSWVDFTSLRPDTCREAIETECTKIQKSLNLTTGPLMRIVYFELGPTTSARLLVVIHHLVVDAYSWRIIAEDFNTAYSQIVAGVPVVLPPKTTSYRTFARTLEAFAHDPALANEATYWTTELESGIPAIPLDIPGGENSESSVALYATSLDADETRALLEEVPEVYGTQINDVLLTALVEAYGRWTGSRVLFAGMEGHGREDISEALDLSRTVGWFTCVYPVRLDLQGIYDPGEMLKTIKEKLRKVPHGGIGYGTLQYLSPWSTSALKSKELSTAAIGFNYLGQLQGGNESTGLLRVADEPRGTERSVSGERDYVIDLTSGVFDGQLRMEWAYSRNLHHESTIRDLANNFVLALRLLVQHCRQTQRAGYTPSDFILAGLDQEELDKILTRVSHP